MLSYLRAQIADAVVAHAEPAIHADLVRLLSRSGYALHPEGKCRAGVFALEVYRSLHGGCDQSALRAAAAVELQMQSAYVFDQVSDGDPEEESRGEDLALAIALLIASIATAAEASSGSPGGAAAMRHFCATTGGACAGQFLDARLERRGGATLEEAHRMTRLKSGNLGAFAAGFAARLAGVGAAAGAGGSDAGVVPLFESLGFNLFTCAQLVDDHRDGCAPGGRSDLARSKATLPVVFFARHRPQPRAGGLAARTFIDSDARGDGTLSDAVHHAYESSGASLYAAVLALAYLGRARADLQCLADHGCPIGPLGRFVEGVESEAARTLGAVGAGVVA
ncbi:MAG TPA: polyprenyl synthetase family protein [Candidatus Polarisedimenticolia bacterium]|nr:polyprenyl synthetase family protein [Candidatus Polarisedimenticolia bacterium]